VHAWLAQPGIAVQAHCPVARLAPPDARQPQWRALDGAGHELARASLVVLAAGFASQALLQDLLRDAAADASRHASANSAALPACLPADPPADSSTGSSAGLSAYLAAPGALPWPSLQAIRGQVSWGAYAAAGALAHLLPATPVNGHGSWMAGVPAEPDVPAWPGVPAETGAASAAGRAELRWLCGASYQRDAQDLAPRPADHLANLARLPVLLPNTGALLAAQLAQTPTQAWVGVRCASRDRLPLVGAVPGMPGQNATAPGLWLCTALGSRGLSYAALCAELLAAWLHQEPLPLPATLARHLQAQRR